MNGRSLLVAAGIFLAYLPSLPAAPVILNEYNAVGSTRYLDGNDYAARPDRGDAFFAVPGVTNGRIQGNGGNWFELVVVEDHVDMRNWQLQWVERNTNTGTGDIWVGTSTIDQGIITLTDAAIWSDLRSGTIITISESEQIPVDTTVQSGNQNFTVPADGRTFEATINLATNISYNPPGGDWWIHASTLDELNSPTPLLRTVTNVQGDLPGNFSVGNDDWQLRILNASAAIQFGPAGEGLGNLMNVGSQEVAKLEENPSASVGPASNYNDGTSSSFGAPNVWQSGMMTQDFAVLRSVIGTGGPVQLRAGDADQDLDFDQLDLVKVQIASKYLTGQAATWGEGDWNGAPGGTQGSPPAGDSLFNQRDIIAAQLANIYLSGKYGALAGTGTHGDGQTSIVYDPRSGELAVDAPAGTQLTSVNIDSAGSIFTGAPAMNLGGSFDNDKDNNIFKATFGSSFGSLSFGNVAHAGLSQAFVTNDLTVVGSLAGGGALGPVDLIYVPEPTTIVLAGLAAVGLLIHTRRSRSNR